MRRQRTGLWQRQDIVPALVACVGVGLVALENADTLRGWYERAQGEPARPHLASACADLEANFEHIADVGLGSAGDLHELDIGRLSSTLVAVDRELDRASRKAGVDGLNSDVSQAIAEAQRYATYQAAVVDAFDLPGAERSADLSDGYLADLLDDLAAEPDAAPRGLVPMDGAPYHAEAHAERLDRLGEGLAVEELSWRFTHHPGDLARIVDDGLAWIGVRESVYLKVGAHLNLPVLSELVHDAEDAVMDELPPEDAQRRREQVADVLAEAGFGGLAPLPDAVTELSVGGIGADVTVGEIERSYQRCTEAFLSVLHALDAMAAGDVADGRELWWDGLARLDTAVERHPFRDGRRL